MFRSPTCGRPYPPGAAVIPAPAGVAGALAAALWLALAACSAEPGSPEAQLRALIARAEAAAEERDAAQLRQLIADDYLDGRGNDKKRIDALIRLSLLRNKSVHLLTRIKEIRLPAPGRADVSLAVAMAGTPFPEELDLNNLRADFQHFDISLIDRGEGDWQVISAEWQRADLQDFL